MLVLAPTLTSLGIMPLEQPLSGSCSIHTQGGGGGGSQSWWGGSLLPSSALFCHLCHPTCYPPGGL